jgi:hypothetical protein
VGWSADAQLQKNGRTHRSDQKVPPRYVLLSSDVGGERRFSSTIAKRLASLGALTKAERKGAGTGELAKYNLETEEGRAALAMFYGEVMRNAREAVPGVENAQQALRDMGILKESRDGGESIKESDMTDIPRFLNRVLALDLKRQNPIFDQYMRTFDSHVNFLKEGGLFDDGVADVKADSIKVKEDPTVVHTDKLTSADTRHYQLEVQHALDVMEFPEAESLMSKEFEVGGQPAFYQQQRSGNFILARRVGSQTDASTGRIKSRYRAWTPERTRVIGDDEFVKYDEASPAEAREWWEERAAKAPRYETAEMHVISGAVLPLWQKLKTQQFESHRVIRLYTDEGERILGIQIPNDSVGSVLRAIGVGRALRTPEDIFRAVMQQNDRLKLAAGLELRRQNFHGEPAIRLMNTTSYQRDQLQNFGLMGEVIDWRQQWFIPNTVEAATPVLTKLLETYPVIDEEPEDPSAQFARPGTEATDRLLRALEDYRERLPAPEHRPAFLKQIARKHMLTHQTLSEALRIERELGEGDRLFDGSRSELPSTDLVPPSADEGFSNGAWRATKELSELFISKSGVIKPFSSLNIVAQNRVLAMMRGLIQDPQILNTVVRFVPVDVVNMLGSQQFTAQMLLHDPSVLVDLLPVNADDLIPSSVQAIGVLAPAVTLASAKVLTGLSRFDISPNDFLTASGTLHNQPPEKVFRKIPQSSEFRNGEITAQFAREEPRVLGMYSQLYRAIGKMGETAPANEVRNLLSNSGVKEDELKWTGFDDYLNQHSTVDKADAQEFVNTNHLGLEEVVKGGQDITRYAQWVLPGEHDKYRELVFTLLAKAPEGDPFKSQHWDEPNPIAHSRIDDRETVDGKAVLFANDVQSDWLQARRRQSEESKNAVTSDFERIVMAMKRAGGVDIEC